MGCSGPEGEEGGWEKRAEAPPHPRPPPHRGTLSSALADLGLWGPLKMLWAAGSLETSICCCCPVLTTEDPPPPPAPPPPNPPLLGSPSLPHPSLGEAHHSDISGLGRIPTPGGQATKWKVAATGQGQMEVSGGERCVCWGAALGRDPGGRRGTVWEGGKVLELDSDEGRGTVGRHLRPLSCALKNGEDEGHLGGSVG